MKNIVSFETAKALKEAGFPQPESEFGQVWYDDHGQPILCIEKIKGQDKWNFRNRHDASLCVNTAFAPTATDILEQLPKNRNLSIQGTGEFFVCKNASPWEGYSHGNAAECLAADYLENIKK